MNDNITEINKDTFWALIQEAKDTCGQDTDAWAKYPQADEAAMRNILEDYRQRGLRIFAPPLSGIKIHGQQINYFDFIFSLRNADCNEALKRIHPRVNMGEITRIVDETPLISDLQKQFYKTMLQTRKERILDFSMEKLRKREKAKELDAR